ncbi:MAG TPA: hypothetical protein VIX35_09740 [Vicinamibacterales bacterium]
MTRLLGEGIYVLAVPYSEQGTCHLDMEAMGRVRSAVGPAPEITRRNLA